MRNNLKKIFVLLALSWQLQVQAENRALIVGITEYENDQYNLPGIELDVGMAKKIASMLGFESSQIKVLTGPQATKKKIKKAINKWLVKGVNPQDKVFLYFSGHGGRIKDKNNDEKDGQDEYITAYDLGEKASEGGYIIDDDLSKWLTGSPSQNKIVMLDSCHSGTATRGLVPAGLQLGNNVLYSKKHKFGKATTINFISKNTIEKSQNSGFLDGHKNQITLAAAHDYEAAQASKKGSLFTLGFYNALSQATQSGKSKNALELVEQAGQFIVKVLEDDEDYLHTPLVFGDHQLAQQPLTKKPTQASPNRNSRGPNWQELKKLATTGKNMSASVNKNAFNVKEFIKFNINIPNSGYLNIINVDAHDEVKVLYPNQFNQANNIKAGAVEIPGKLMAFDLPASRPVGDSLTVFVFTTKPLNLYKNGIDVRNSAGEFTATLASMSEQSYRSIDVAARNQSNEIYTTAIKTTVR